MPSERDSDGETWMRVEGGKIVNAIAAELKLKSNVGENIPDN